MYMKKIDFNDAIFRDGYEQIEKLFAGDDPKKLEVARKLTAKLRNVRANNDLLLLLKFTNWQNIAIGLSKMKYSDRKEILLRPDLFPDSIDAIYIKEFSKDEKDAFLEAFDELNKL